MNKAQLLARLQEITQTLTVLNSKEVIEQADLDQMATLSKETESIQNSLNILQASEEAVTKAQASAGRNAPPAGVPAGKPKVEAHGKDRFGGFDSSASFLSAVRRAGTGDVHEILKSAHYEKSGEDGGYLVPEDIRTEIQSVMMSEDSLYAKTNRQYLSGNSLTLPVDHNQPWNQGVKAYWIKEGGELIKSQGVLGRASWKLNKQGVLVPLTEELREDSVAMESFIKSAAPRALMHLTNTGIITGDGVGEMTGILESPFTVTVEKELNQDADTINTRNVVNMYTRLMPQARRNAFWMVTAEAEAQLMLLKDDNGNFIYLQAGTAFNSSPFGMLLGRPVIPMMYGVNPLGDRGDIILADLSYYTTIAKAGIRQDISTHVYFERDMAAFRFIQRIDGKTPFQKPVKAEKSNYTVSAFVTLEDRA